MMVSGFLPDTGKADAAASSTIITRTAVATVIIATTIETATKRCCSLFLSAAPDLGPAARQQALNLQPAQNRPAYL